MSKDLYFPLFEKAYQWFTSLPYNRQVELINKYMVDGKLTAGDIKRMYNEENPTIVINNQRYRRKTIEKDSTAYHRDRILPMLIGLHLVTRSAVEKLISGHKSESQIKEIAKEYELIAQKKSNLPASKRNHITYLFHKYYEQEEA